MVNNMIKKQRGISFWELSTALAILGFFIYMGLTIFPLYNEKLTVRYVMEGVASKPEAAKLSITEVRKSFLKGMNLANTQRFNSSNIKNFVQIREDKKAKKRYMQVAYEAKQNFIKDLNFLLIFDEEMELGVPVSE